MNFKDWIKLDEDDKTVTLKHPKGHTMTIFAYALPKIQREQLKRLPFAKGGKVEKEEGISEQGKDVRYGNKSQHKEDKEMSRDFAREEAKGRADFERQVKPNIKGLAEGGEVENPGNRYNNEKGVRRQPHGGRAEVTLPSVELKKAKENPEHAAVYKNNAKNMSKENLKELKSMPAPNIKGLAGGGEVAHYDQGASDVSDDDIAKEVAQEDAGAPTAQLDESKYFPEQSENQPLPEPTKAPGTIESPQFSPMAKAEQNQINAQQERLNWRQSMRNLYTDQTGRFAIDQMKNPPRPNAYLEDMSTPQKVTTAIGLFLGGLGTPFGGHNYAQDFLDKQIDRNIEGQKMRIGQQKSIWEAYHHLFGDDVLADSATKDALAEIHNSQVQQAKFGLNTPQAHTNAAQFAQHTQDLKTQAAGQFENRLHQLSNGAQPINKVKAPPTQKLPSNHPPDSSGEVPRFTPPVSIGSPQASAVGSKNNIAPSNISDSEMKSLSPSDPKWGDSDAKPWSGKVPKSAAPPLVKIDYDKMNASAAMAPKPGEAPVPGVLPPGQVGAAQDAASQAEATNQALKEIHNQFGEMWKNASPGNDAIQYIGSQHLWGMHLPDISNWTTEGKRYLTAASTVKKQIANAMKGGGSQEVYDLIEANLPKYTDSPSDYRQKLQNIDKIMLQQIPQGVLKQYKLATGLP